MLDPQSQRIIETLQQQAVLTAEQAAAVAQQTIADPRALQQVLVGNRLVEEEAFVQIWAQVVGLPYIDLRTKTIPKEVRNIIPESTARSHLIVAYDQTSQALRVAMVNPNDRQIVEFLQKKMALPVEVALSSATSVKIMLERYQESLESELQTLAQDMGRVGPVDDDNKAAEELPIIRITDAILRHAIVQRASDIHLEPLDDRVIVRYRIDGILHDMLTLPKLAMIGLAARIKVLSSLKIDEHRLPQDGRFKISNKDYQVAFRVSILPVFDGEKIVMRLLDESGESLGLNDIGLNESMLGVLRRNLQKPHGMILVTGPTGSGKTTTLYAAMKELNTTAVNISTIEDPIEYRMPRINQTQVKPQIGLTFANGLRALVRQDPDIIMVGEIRDEETASLAINAALTGHLVLSTLHTNSAAGAIPRLLDMKVEAFLLASTVNLVMAQRLVRRLCVHCRQAAQVDQAILDSLKDVLDSDHLLEILQREGAAKKDATWTQVPFYQAVGCSACGGTGYRGRIGIYECMEMTPAIQALTTPQATSQQLEDAARREQGMITMLEEGVIKAVSGVTTIEEILRVAKE